MIMNENKRSGESYHFPTTTQTTRTTPADIFFMDFVGSGSDLNDNNGVEGSNESRTDMDDYANGSSSLLHDMPFSSQLEFDFPIRESNINRFNEETQTTIGLNRASSVHRIPSAMSDSSGTAAPTLNSNSVPEFLYQLTKMLTENNNDVIEWSHGRIEVHSPQRLESDVLKKYFRHSKFASFQRQLNYFGFRKLAGKGKMAPCSYVNDAAMDDIGSLFLIKRKSGPDPLDTSIKKKKEKNTKLASTSNHTTAVNPVLAGIYNRSTKQYQKERNPLAVSHDVSDNRVVPNPISSTTSMTIPPPAASGANISNMRPSAHHELARRAIGRGIRHSIGSSNVNSLPPVPMPLLPPVPIPLLPSSTSTANSLSELANNYQNSLKEDIVTEESDGDPTPLSRMQSRIDSNFDGMLEDSQVGFLSSNSSLIDLAMLAPVDEALNGTTNSDDNGNPSGDTFEFLDFPNS